MTIPDVNVDTPDKKSVLMYLMCLFKVLPHTDIPTDADGELSLSPTTPKSPSSAKNAFQEFKSSNVSPVLIHI